MLLPLKGWAKCNRHYAARIKILRKVVRHKLQTLNKAVAKTLPPFEFPN
jgi:hypothetical protein